MSYRVYVHTRKGKDRYQCLGNNEFPQFLVKELEKQGCKIDEDDCFYNFEIKDLQRNYRSFGTIYI